MEHLPSMFLARNSVSVVQENIQVKGACIYRFLTLHFKPSLGFLAHSRYVSDSVELFTLSKPSDLSLTPSHLGSHGLLTGPVDAASSRSLTH